MKKILFITWDGPQTNYMEGLFIPILSAVQKKDSEYQFHVLQFTWGDESRINITRETAQKFNLVYNSAQINRKPIASIGSLLTIILGYRKIRKYIKQNNIDVLMPRSIMPAIMVNIIKECKPKILFDADGLPIEERVDFGNLQKDSFIYRFLQEQENKILKKADVVITRSLAAIKYHTDRLGIVNEDKFFVVKNGRDENIFKRTNHNVLELRNSLGFKSDSFVFIYCGSLGPQYGWDDMLEIFNNYYKYNNNSYFLILTGSKDYLYNRIPDMLKDRIIVKNVSVADVPAYLNIADMAFAIRKPTLSMKGVAPIKLGEYFLLGLRVIASKGIGDTDDILKELPSCYLYDDNSPKRIDDVIDYLIKLEIENNNFAEIRKIGKKYFSIDSAATSYLLALNHLEHTDRNT